MPEFQLDTSGVVKMRPSAAPEPWKPGHWLWAWADLDAFTQGYIEAAFFTEGDELWSQIEAHAARQPAPVLMTLGFSDLAPETLARIIEDCAAFQRANMTLLDAAYERDYDAAQAGRDFWFTRNGHGVGYWERPALDARAAWEALGRPKVGEEGWAEFVQARADSLGDQLTRAAKAFGQVDAYLGDDGKVYQGGG